MTSERVDAHHHWWADPDLVPWLASPGHAALRRPFRLAELRPHLLRAGIGGTVLVEAGCHLHEELDLLLQEAATQPEIRGVVGWLDARQEGPEVAERVTSMFSDSQAATWLKGLRLQTQHGEPGDLRQPGVVAAACELGRQGRVMELVVRPRHLPEVARLARRVPGVVMVVDHAGKPDIAGQTKASFEAWLNAMMDLARCPSVVVKVSGLVTEAGPSWTWHDLYPYVDSLISLFGPERLMWGSDWPVCLLAAEYEEVVDASQRCLENLAADELAHVLGGTATRVYGLGGPMDVTAT